MDDSVEFTDLCHGVAYSRDIDEYAMYVTTS